EKEKQSAITNYAMGVSFITEGAIPFAAADPVRVIGSSIFGAAIAGGLTQLWSSAIPAPHGGIYVLALADHPLLFLLALSIGSVISAVILSFWKKPVSLFMRLIVINYVPLLVKTCSGIFCIMLQSPFISN